MRFAALLGTLLACLTLSPFAQAATIRTEVSQRKVGVGQEFTITLITELEEDEETASHPRLRIPDSFIKRPPSVGSRRSFSFGTNGAKSNRSSTATWRVVAQKVGSFTIGPGKISVDGVQYNGERLSIVVVEPDNAPTSSAQRRQQFGSRSFDPWALLQGNQSTRPSQLPAAADYLSLEKAPNAVAFLRVIADKQSIIVGEAMKVGLYLYGSQGAFPSPSASTPPSLAQFKSYPIVTSALEQSPRQVLIGGVRFRVQKLQEWVVVPLVEGQLHLGEASISLPRARQFGSRRTSYGLEALAPDQVIQVSAAPIQGQPAGFQSGNVGRFYIDAQVTPRQVHLNDYVEVRLRLNGRGNLPSVVLPPEINGVTWNKPATTSNIEVKNGQLVGQRLITFTAQATREGEIKLGTISVPFYDSRRSTYGVAKTQLGNLNVLGPRQAPSGTTQATPNDKKPAPVDAVSIAPELNLALPLQEFEKEQKSESLLPFKPWLALLPPPIALIALLLTRLSLLMRRSKKRAKKMTALMYLAQAKQEAHDTERLRSLELALWRDAEEKIEQPLSSLSDNDRSTTLKQANCSAAYIEIFEDLLRQLQASRYGRVESSLSTLLQQTDSLLKTPARPSKS